MDYTHTHTHMQYLISNKLVLISYCLNMAVLLQTLKKKNKGNTAKKTKKDVFFVSAHALLKKCIQRKNYEIFLFSCKFTVTET